MKTMSMIYYWC